MNILCRADDEDWAGSFLTFNRAVAKTPALIVFVGTVDHIKEALQFAFKYNIKVSIVSSGKPNSPDY